MILTTDKEARWKLFEDYSARYIMTLSGNENEGEFALTPKEYADFIYLKHYFANDYVKARSKPWLPNFFSRRKQ